jgi:mitogen-activated protein kinase 1/3
VIIVLFKENITFVKPQPEAAPSKGGGGRSTFCSTSNYKKKHAKDSSSETLSDQFYQWTKKMQDMACTGTLPRGFSESESEPKIPRHRDEVEHHLFEETKKMISERLMSQKIGSSNDEMDMHTLATASTSAATLSYGSMADDASEVSEAGMEVVMASEESEQVTFTSFKAGKETFTIDTRYSMIRTIGSGAYGTVISATDLKTGGKVAIKMVARAFNDEIDAKRILREIKLMKHFQHENIVNVLDMMPPRAKILEDFDDVYIVADLMETDLHRIIYSKQPLSIDHVQYFVYQILRGLKYIHSANVVHRDLKPSNLLVNSNCDLKICDFGLARGIMTDNEMIRGDKMLLTEYVVTRWYRAPEIMLACHEYSKPVDVWSVGCVFAELILRKPFFPGDDYIDQVRATPEFVSFCINGKTIQRLTRSGTPSLQLTIISEKLGKLPEADLDFVTSEKAKRFMRKLPDKVPPPLSRQFPGVPATALDAMRKMLQVHPGKRITVEEALAHPFFEPLHSPDDEPVAEEYFDFSFEQEKLHRRRLRELIWKEAAEFRPSCLPVAPSRGHSGLHEA